MGLSQSWGRGQGEGRPGSLQNDISPSYSESHPVIRCSRRQLVLSSCAPKEEGEAFFVLACVRLRKRPDSGGHGPARSQPCGATFLLLRRDAVRGHVSQAFLPLLPTKRGVCLDRHGSLKSQDILPIFLCLYSRDHLWSLLAF